MKSKTTQDLLTLLSPNQSKTVLVQCGATRKQLQCLVYRENGVKYLKVENFHFHNRSSGGQCEFLFTPKGMQQLDQYIKFWFSDRNKPKKYKPSNVKTGELEGWTALENLMNQTWKR